MTRKVERVAAAAGRMAARENMAGDGRLRIVSTYKAQDGSSVGIRLNDSRCFTMSVKVLDYIERHMSPGRSESPAPRKAGAA